MLLLLALALAAPAPDAQRWPLAGVTVTGNKVFPAEAIVRAAGLKIGQPVNRADLEAAAQRLTDAGVFETLSFRYEPVGKQLAVTFEVQEVVDLYPVAFARLPEPDADLMRYLGERVPLFGPQAPATGAMARRIIEALQARLKTEITGRLQPGPDGALRMTFYPAAALPSITFVRFEGAKVLRDVDLQAAIYQTAVGVPYTEARLVEILDHGIRPLFEQKGRLRVKFGPFAVKESKEPAGVEVTVPVQEGEEFQFGELRFEGHSHVSQRDLSRLTRIASGELANYGLVLAAASDIERLYRRNGFLSVKAAPSRTIDDEKKTVDVVIRIAEGDLYRFRTLFIKGLDINAEAAVRRRWAIERGKPYDDSYPEVFLRRIEEEAMFSGLAKTTHRVIRDEAGKQVDVELVFHGEAPPRTRR